MVEINDDGEYLPTSTSRHFAKSLFNEDDRQKHNAIAA
jgi:hypothetical protein